MAQLVSPGVDITIINDAVSQIQSPGTVPVIFIATQANKLNPTGTAIASGTLTSNIGKPYTLTSQRELLQTFGNPFFRKVDGTIQQGDELNEYGLHAAWSYLGRNGRAIVVRGDVDMGQLLPSEIEPTSAPTNGTYWFDYSNSSFGVFVANGSSTSGLAWDKVNVKFPGASEVGNGPTFAPLNTFGSAGDYAISIHNTNNALYEKIGIEWYQVGSSLWKAARPTILTGTVGFTSGGTLGVSGNLVINGITIALLNTDTLAGVIAKIVGVTDVTATFATIGTALANRFFQLTNTAGLDIIIGSGSTPGVMSALGVVATTTPGYRLYFSPHTTVPSGLHDGDIWVKTTTPNFGAKYVVKVYNSSLGTFQTVTSPFYADDILSEIGNGLSTGKVYTRFNVGGTTANPLGATTIKRLGNLSTVHATSTAFSAPAAGAFTIRTRSSAGLTPNTDTTITVTLAGSETASQIVTLINTAVATSGAVPHIVASVYSAQLRISSTNGSAFELANSSATPLTTITLAPGMYSNWATLSYQATIIQPSNSASENTLWFNPALTVDIMVNTGNSWVGYRNMYSDTDPAGVQVTSLEPTTQSDGSSLVDNDLWLDSDDVINYPKLYRYLNGEWVLVDVLDHTTPLGMVFGDARHDTGPTGFWLQSKTAPLSGTAAAQSKLTSDLLHSDFVDPVDLTVLNPQTYPAGILLFNTRFSTNNVKIRHNNYYLGSSNYTVGTFLNDAYEAAHPGSRAAVLAYLTDLPGRWVTHSGLDLSEVAYFGRNAQRIVVVRSLAEQIVSNEQIRSDALFFNLSCAPGYVEVLDELVTLNIDRRETCFIISDVPSTLSPDATSTQAWATNVNNVPSNGKLGRITLYDYAAMYYPWALGTNVDGSEVVIPSSTVALRTYGYNDSVAYPWYAPAGSRRGVITNAASVGYLSEPTYTYNPITLNPGQRDVLYLNKINPLAFIPGQGLQVYGNKTLATLDTNLTSRVNVARLVVYIRWIIPQLLQAFLFEQNTESTRAAAKDVLDKFMVGLIGLNAISDFINVVDSNNNTPETIHAHELHTDNAIVPVESIEFIYAAVRLKISL